MLTRCLVDSVAQTMMGVSMSLHTRLHRLRTVNSRSMHQLIWVEVGLPRGKGNIEWPQSFQIINCSTSKLRNALWSTRIQLFLLDSLRILQVSKLWGEEQAPPIVPTYPQLVCLSEEARPEWANPLHRQPSALSNKTKYSWSSSSNSYMA